MSHPKRPLHFLTLAETDLNDIYSYIASDNKKAAESVLAKIESTIGLICDNPFIGRLSRHKQLARVGYRYMVVQNYLILYIVEDEAIVIHRILHSARDYLTIVRPVK